MTVEVVIVRGEVAEEDSSLPLAGADKSATPLQLGSKEIDRIWLASCFSNEYTSVIVTNVQVPGRQYARRRART